MTFAFAARALCPKLPGWMKWFLQIKTIFCLLSGANFLWAGEVPVAATPSTNASFQQVAPGVFQIGAVTLNQSEQSVQFPAAVNMTNGSVEYFIVTGTGKLHESVLKAEVDPAQIHVAMLLLGAQEASTNAATTNISGSKFTLKLSWKNGGVEKIARGEDWVFNRATHSAMSRGDWVYNASKVLEGTFIAHRDGSIVSIISDPLALANNTRPGCDNDELWSVNTNAVPALNTPVAVTFKLLK